MRRRQLCDARPAQRLAHCALERLVAHMVSPYEATPRVRRPPVGREHVLSTPFAGGAWIRSLERSGQPDSAQAVAQINAMQVLDIMQMPAQRADEAIGED